MHFCCGFASAVFGPIDAVGYELDGSGIYGVYFDFEAA
jgi:hypothetical protein